MPASLPLPARLLTILAAALLLASPRLDAQTPARWTRGATCYEVFVRSFQDSDGDGIGDLRGLISRLDYINDGRGDPRTSLGARCIWLMPVAESPSYHGYDVSDYYTVARQYGTNEDFRRLVREAHRRGIRVLVDMVLNHASSEGAWFQSALRDTTSPYRGWFRFASPKPAGRGPWNQDAWIKSPVRDEYYYAIFCPCMPDLNWANPAVAREAQRIARYWLQDMGVDGFRLDAVAYLSEDNGRLQHSPGTHAALRDYQRGLRRIKPDVFTVGEVFAPTDTVLPYYPDQLDAYFAFEVADSIVAGVARGDALNLLAPALRLQREAPPQRWLPFLRNHDQPRTRTELGGDVAKARVAAVLLLTLPGMPFVYYGEELGMTGTKPDERLRTPMQWTAGPGAGFTTGKPWQQLAHDSLTTTVAAQTADTGSLLSLHRRLIHLRTRAPAIAGGSIVPLTASHPGVAAYLRRSGNRSVLVLANLGAEAVGAVTLSSTTSVLPPGRWRLRELLGAQPPAATLVVDGGGRLSAQSPLTTLAAKQAHVFALERVRR